MLYLLCFAIGRTGGNSQCEGDACAAVLIEWQDGDSVYLITNQSDHRVRVELSSGLTTTEILLEPHRSKSFRGKTIIYPYFAVYCN